jgi:hypothetical protein
MGHLSSLAGPLSCRLPSFEEDDEADRIVVQNQSTALAVSLTLLKASRELVLENLVWLI